MKDSFIIHKALHNLLCIPKREGYCSGWHSYRNNVVYHLYAAILGGKTAINEDMVYQKVEYNGFKFKFNCYENELIRNIQLSLIELDLIQTVGKARTLRTKATIQLYSNFSLRISSTFIFFNIFGYRSLRYHTCLIVSKSIISPLDFIAHNWD